MRELPAWLKHTTVWLLLGLGLLLAVQAWQRHQQASRVVVQGGELRLQRAADGHYHWPARVAAPGGAGQAVEFLVDTGATATALPLALAQALALQPVGAVTSSTAGGVVQAQVMVADIELHGGVRAERLRVTVLPQLAAPLLGMDVLGRLRWQQEQGVMRVQLQGGAR
jgi:aspartyl protease family protein